MSDSPADHIKDYLEANGFTVPIFVGTEPAGLEFCITIYDTGGSHANQDAGLQDPTIQIRGRGLNYGELYTTISSMRDLLIRPTSRVINGWFYTGFWLVSDVAKIGRDDNNRELMVVNLRLMRQIIDRTALVAALNAAMGLNEAFYTPESWQALSDAVAIGVVVNANLSASQQQVSTAATNIFAAIDALEFMPIIIFDGDKLGVWFDASDLSTLFQDAEGTIPVTQDGDPVGLMLDKSGNGRHASQTVEEFKPMYRTDGVRHWIEFDTVDDYLEFAAAAYTGAVSISIGYRVYTPPRWAAWTSMVGALGNAFGLARASSGQGPAWTPSGWAPNSFRVNGQSLIHDPSVLRELLAELSSDVIVGAAERVRFFTGTSGWDTTPRQLINYANQAKPGGEFYQYIEVESDDFGDALVPMEKYIADKTGVTLSQ